MEPIRLISAPVMMVQSSNEADVNTLSIFFIIFINAVQEFSVSLSCKCTDLGHTRDVSDGDVTVLCGSYSCPT